MEQISMESIEKHREISVRRLCFMVSQGIKHTLGKIQEKMVWSI
jgi:hypothetical protein